MKTPMKFQGLDTPVNKKQWNSFCNSTPIMHGMYIQFSEAFNSYSNIDLRELLIQLLLLRTPVKLLAPHGGRSLDFMERNAHVPPRSLELVGEGSVLQLVAEPLEFLVRNGDAIWGD